jgi:hypothetical protein
MTASRVSMGEKAANPGDNLDKNSPFFSLQILQGPSTILTLNGRAR